MKTNPSRSGREKEREKITPFLVAQTRENRILWRRSVAKLLRKIILIAAALTLVLLNVFGVAMAEGESMYPTMKDGDLVFYYRLDRTWNIGDIVTFKKDSIRYWGRIVAMQGDTVDMDQDGNLLINGNIQSESVFYETYKTEASVEFPCTVGEGELFLLGDMRTSAMDSRDYGAVSGDAIDGKLFTLIKRRDI